MFIIHHSSHRTDFSTIRFVPSLDHTVPQLIFPFLIFTKLYLPIVVVCELITVRVS